MPSHDDLRACNPHTDAYINQAKPFAQPILAHLRDLIHKACPQVEESIKWSRPFFIVNGVILCYLAAYKQHCALGFWGKEMEAAQQEAGLFDRIASLADHPPINSCLPCSPSRQIHRNRHPDQPHRCAPEG